MIFAVETSVCHIIIGRKKMKIEKFHRPLPLSAVRCQYHHPGFFLILWSLTQIRLTQVKKDCLNLHQVSGFKILFFLIITDLNVDSYPVVTN